MRRTHAKAAAFMESASLTPFWHTPFKRCAELSADLCHMLICYKNLQ